MRHRSPLGVIAPALTLAWAFVAGAATVANAEHLASLPAADLAAIVAGALAPVVLLWVGVAAWLQHLSLSSRLAEFERRQEELSLQIRLLLNAARRGEMPVGITTDPGSDSDHAVIQVMEGEEVGPEFIHRHTQVGDDWIEVEFRNVGGPADDLMAITEGDTETRVTAETVGSWKSVTVSLQPVATSDEPFRFCLVFKNARGEEGQQFFRYNVQNVISIAKPEL